MPFRLEKACRTKTISKCLQPGCPTRKIPGSLAVHIQSAKAPVALGCPYRCCRVLRGPWQKSESLWKIQFRLLCSSHHNQLRKCAAFNLWKHGFCPMPAFSPPQSRTEGNISLSLMSPTPEENKQKAPTLTACWSNPMSGKQHFGQQVPLLQS